MKDFFDTTYAELIELCRPWSVQHAKAIFRSLYKDYSLEPLNAPSLPREMVARFSEQFYLNTADIYQESVSRYDGTVKFLVRLADGALIEAVLMPERSRITLCVSSQVGCAQACSFCHTGRMGLKRQLTAGEIVAQLMLARRWIRAHPQWREERGFHEKITVNNIVFMGMGEPLDNVEALKRSLTILCETIGPNLSLRKISVSTAGHLDGIKNLLEAFPKVSLALSLHATQNRERSQLMPINRRWPIADVIAYLKEFYARANDDDRSVLIQYTVISGVNDAEEQAQGIVDLLVGLPVKINIIPLNVVGPSQFKGPEPEALERFRDYLHRSGFRVMVRYSKGQDIDAACGQLVVQHEKQAASESISRA
ncbi:MAG: 23S rRNA (adenine(2503)-C(2))-methyltransferase RlmN [Chitinophagaceae bacterium]|nr:23S rRNA (adenine(2503)-C(2))-methyltransferase RlmN [Oligoflexus sp.]